MEPYKGKGALKESTFREKIRVLHDRYITCFMIAIRNRQVGIA